VWSDPQRGDRRLPRPEHDEGPATSELDHVHPQRNVLVAGPEAGARPNSVERVFHQPAPYRIVVDLYGPAVPQVERRG
jgi:hypothetical protein